MLRSPLKRDVLRLRWCVSSDRGVLRSPLKPPKKHLPVPVRALLHLVALHYLKRDVLSVTVVCVEGLFTGELRGAQHRGSAPRSSPAFRTPRSPSKRDVVFLVNRDLVIQVKET